MSFFISDAVAQGAAAPQGGGLQTFIFLLVFVAIFYFLLIRPQAKRAKDHKNMVAALQKGDEVVTSGGILGKITKVTDDFVVLEVAGEVELTLQRQAISSLMPKGTIKSL